MVITTPQRLSRVDVLKGIAMFAELRVPILSLVENMSYFTDPHGGVLLPLTLSLTLTTGEITIDEMTIMIRTLVAGCGKMDKGIAVPTMWPYRPRTAAPLAVAQTVRRSRDAPSRRNMRSSTPPCVSSPFDPP